MHPMRKSDRQASEETAYQILANGEYAVLCTLNEGDGSPYGVPLSLAVQDKVIYMHGALEGHKLENLRNDPRVCVTCVGRTQPYPKQFSTDYESVVAIGKAELVTDREEKLKAMTIFCKKYSPMMPEEALEKKLQGGIDRLVVIRIPVDEISGKERWRNPPAETNGETTI